MIFFGVELSYGVLKGYALAVLLLLASFIAIRLLYKIIRRSLRKAAERTKTHLDDILLEYIEKPLTIFISLLVVLYMINAYLPMGEGALRLFNDLFKGVIALDLAWLFIGMINALFENYFLKLSAEHKKLDITLAPMIKKLVAIVIFAIALMLILSNYGYNISALLGGFGLAGLALGLAAQDTLKDVLGGVAVVSNKAFSVGDWVKIDNVEGTVSEISIRYTKLRTFDGSTVTVPNAKVGTSVVEDFDAADSRRFTIEVGIPYELPAKKIERALAIMQGAANSQKHVSKGKTTIRIKEFGDSAVILRLWYYLGREGFDDALDIKHRVLLEIKKGFDREKIDFAYPTRTIYMKK